ncbi:DUF2397 domain-containing protein [Rhodococcus sp. Z13]|uniref:DUF2397 domain-containing protein n=1 Tax=Rhodococcus sacchari TaxID=2962047 RepID=A0ACD4DJZ1_9NOCA|nr:DUF2397 domain-containing protein [Rhodococcus sp. Z13]UYP20283.1 DUF2397 domain-containing protein [Rhodococcus sp. Z13]
MGRDADRNLFRHLVVDDADDHLAVLDCFTDLLPAELSAEQVAAACTARGRALDPERAEASCRQLVGWGNLAAVHPGTSGDGGSGTVRYRITPAGVRVHRETTALLASREDTRGIAPAPLGPLVDALDDLLDATASVLEPSAQVTAVFDHHRRFTAGVADLHAQLAEVLGRWEQTPPRDAAEVDTLIEQVDRHAADVRRHAPRVATRLSQILPRLDLLLAALPGTFTSPGRDRAEWEALARWYADDAGPRRVREAAAAALNRLLTHAHRTGTGAPDGSHRAELLRLARRFADAPDAQAHRLFAATFGTHPSRHLLCGPREPDPRAGAGTSWWHTEPVAVPAFLRERVESGTVAR